MSRGYEQRNLQMRAVQGEVTVRSLLPLPRQDAQLDRIVEAVDFDRVKVGDAIEWFRQHEQLNILPQWSRIETSGSTVTEATLVTLHLKHVTVRQALDGLLLPLAGDRNLGWYSHDGIVVLSTDDAASTGMAVVRIYDVRPLLEEAAMMHALFPQPDAKQGSVGYTFSNSQQQGMPMESESEDVDRLKKMIVDNGQAVTWKDNGGDVGVINYWAGQMIIEQTEAAHQEIERLLVVLRQPK